MIRVTYYRAAHRVTVIGHAESGEFGRDLICAACSALTVTLADNVEALAGHGQMLETRAELVPGNAEVKCTPTAPFRTVVKLIFDVICIGFERLSRECPDHIAYEIR